jgi:hypothetical protein
VQNRCIIITGTITPNVDITIDEDPMKRRQAYLDNLKFYSNFLKEPIYFLENSSYPLENDLEFLEVLKERDIRLVRFPKNPEKKLGKGYQEFKMIDQIVKDLTGKYKFFIKITGRYRYSNIIKLIENSNNDILMDLIWKDKIAITSIFYMSFDFYSKYLCNLYKIADDSQGNWIEKVIYNNMHEQELIKNIDFFAYEPIMEIATKNYSRRDYMIMIIKRFIKNIERYLFKKFSIRELYM